MKVCTGGTFDTLHRGHKDLLDKACQAAGSLLIGLCSDQFATRSRRRAVTPFMQRRKALVEYLLEYHPHVDSEVVVLDDEFGPALEGDFAAIVVSEATQTTAVKLNHLREAAGRQPLKVVVVPHRLAQDGLPISSTRIAEGELDSEGRLQRPLKVAIGTANPVKVEAVKSVCDLLYPEVVYHHRGVDSGVAEQPRGATETAKGALNRARAVLQGDWDFGVGVEAGLVESPQEGEWLDVQYCVVVDKGGRVTLGHGAGFAYPPSVLTAVQQGLTVGEAMERLSGVPGIGRRQGAIGYLSRGALDRSRLTEQAVLAAFVPRLRQELYHQNRPS